MRANLRIGGLVTALVLVTGCATVPVSDVGAGSRPASAASDVPADDPLGVAGAPLVGAMGAFDESIVSPAFDAERMGAAPPGAAVRYRRGDGSVGTVRAAAAYAAASGRSCRALLDDAGVPTGRVLCATGRDAGWVLVPRLGAADAR